MDLVWPPDVTNWEVSVTNPGQRALASRFLSCAASPRRPMGHRPPPLTAHGDAARFSPQSRGCGVAPGPSNAAIRVAAKILLQVGPRVGGKVDSGIERRSARSLPPPPPVSPHDPSVSADRPARHSLWLMWVATPPQLALDA